MNITARQLRAFVALADEHHFTRAAARCHQTQPAFSALIKSLEDALGVRLFERSTRRVELTAEGRLLNRSATRLLRDMEAVVQDVRDHVAIRKGRVSVAALPSLAAGWLPDIYARFHAEHPGVELTLHDALLEPCLALVRSGAADIAVAAQGVDMSGLDAETLYEDAFYLVCRDDHPLARKRAVRLRDIEGCAMIQLGKGSSVRQSLIRNSAFRKLGTFLEVDHLATVTGLVVAGLGVSLVPAMTLFQFKHARLRVIPLVRQDAVKRSLYLIRRSDRGLSSAAQAFYDVLLRERAALGT
ncbi:LysR family transcriptional regulator [Allopusillimonas ginsengisoli]|uniref:LysR family transcriptional regulator n=1 Tax=Allopusillimonas ginsengisoli TaxID=453575 RepID=UPI00101EDD22|nr:LysR family transcriptional regulator [Allopusillimonas ginsengisoli]TEA70399.1 LysR family transcriptional regulator [Allopusillimonas ginsengisoli]